MSSLAGNEGETDPAEDDDGVGNNEADTHDPDDDASGPNAGNEDDAEHDSSVSPRTLAIGDSILEWNYDEGSIPEVLADDAGLDVTNAAIGGTRMLEGEDSIPEQYFADDWGRVLLNGGGNDIGECGCEHECLDVVDTLIADDAGSGVMVSLVERIAGDGAEVILMGYYAPLPDAEFYRGCEDLLQILNDRYQRLAETNPAVLFVDTSEVVAPDIDRAHYDEDGVHPSLEGSAVIGHHIAQRLADAG